MNKQSRCIYVNVISLVVLISKQWEFQEGKGALGGCHTRVLSKRERGAFHSQGFSLTSKLSEMMPYGDMTFRKDGKVNMKTARSVSLFSRRRNVHG